MYLNNLYYVTESISATPLLVMANKTPEVGFLRHRIKASKNEDMTPRSSINSTSNEVVSSTIRLNKLMFHIRIIFRRKLN